MTDPWKFNHMNIILGTGEWDNTRHESLRLSAILTEKGIRHWLDDRRWCGHDWNIGATCCLITSQRSNAERLTRIAFSPNPCHPPNPRLTLL
jgi:hypothetical protein